MDIDPKEEVEKIVAFLKTTAKKQHIPSVIIGISGGIDSAASLYLLAKAYPLRHIYPVYMPYFHHKTPDIAVMLQALGIPKKNFQVFSIKTAVDTLAKTQKVANRDTARLGIIMARVRMITLFDLAKKTRALVCGTENKSEHLLGYFTRFGDEASDIEPIRHLYKTHVYELAHFLGVPQATIDKAPTAGLWKQQTDEKEFGFSYKEADQVLFLHFEKHLSEKEIARKGFPNTQAILKRALDNEYKHHVPYVYEGR